MCQLVITEKSNPKDIAGWLKSGRCNELVIWTDATIPTVTESIKLAHAAGLGSRAVSAPVDA